MNEVDEFIVRRNLINSIIKNNPSRSRETLWDQSVRYGKIAYEAFSLKMHHDDFCWDKLTDNEKFAWIEVGTQIERITLIEQE